MAESDPTEHPTTTSAEPDRAPETVVAEQQPITSTLAEAAGYSKIGPGPISSIRFRWTVRRGDDGSYYVDETVGDASLPIATGPMSAAAAIRLVDELERQALSRFERFRDAMSAQGTDEDLFADRN